MAVSGELEKKSVIQRLGSIVSPLTDVLRIRDFALLWSGALLSFTGAWIQRVGQDRLAFDLSHNNEFILGVISFCGMAPVTVLGPIMGAYVDIANRRKLLIWILIVNALGAAFLGFATQFGFIIIPYIMLVSLLNGFMSTMEMPARQSIVREVVPASKLAAAIPAQALTFNFARIIGPAIGGILVANYGFSSVFFVNAVSYTALILAVVFISAEMGPSAKEAAPIKDLVREGFNYTFRDKTLRTLFLMEAFTSMFGITYIALMSSIAKEKFGLGVRGQADLYTALGVGAVIGLVSMASVSQRKIKVHMVKFAMVALALANIGIGLATNHWVAKVFLAIAGACAIIQFNTTNTLFQLIAPANLRGRVLSMHMWAVSGLAPIGVLSAGYLAEKTNVSITMICGGVLVLIAALFHIIRNRGLLEPDVMEMERSENGATRQI